MKKKILILLVIALMICGCGKEEDDSLKRMENYDISAWKIDLSSKSTSNDEEIKTVFNNATSLEKEKKYEFVSLLATQVVSGTNYMYLAKCTIENDTKWYIVKVYEDLSGKSEITYEKEFDLSNYTYEKEYVFNEDEFSVNNKMVGGWTINTNINTSVNEEIVKLFNDATSNLDKVTYKPIVLIATQKTDGTHYAMLSYGTLNKDNTNILSLISFYIDENNKSYINSIYNIDLDTFSE